MRTFYIALFTSLASLYSFTSAWAQAPQNDNPCNAINLPLSANENCSNALAGTTVNATTSSGLGYVNPVECGVASQPKDVWYKVTTTATGAGSTKLHFKLSPAGSNPMVSGNITLFKANGSCPSLTMSLISGACINSSSAAFTPISLTVHFLTPNTTYYLRVNPVNNTDATGTFDVCAYLPIATPPCVQYISPLPNATNVPVNQYVTFEWAASPGATLYNFYVGTANPPFAPTSGTATKDSSKFLSYNKKYYWSVAPRNSTGAATGCPIDSFTTAPAPANCIPLTTINCRTNDTLKLVKLTGENGTSINNPTGCSPNGYADYTGTTNVQLAQNKAYAGLLQASFVHDFFTIWIDYNDDGYFTNDERVLNNLRQQWSKEPTPFTINIPATATVGTHKMRVRNVYYAVNPAVGSVTTDPCNNYTYSETEDYSVSIIPAINAPSAIVAPGINNSCMQTGSATIDTATNNNAYLVQVVDPSNAVVAAIDANGNDLGAVQATVYKNAGAIRTLGNGTKVLDRNITVKSQFQPVSPVRVRLYLTNQELAALQSTDPTITGVGSLSVTKVDDSCSTGGSSLATGALVAQTGNGAMGADHYIDITVAGFSNFYIHGGNSVVSYDTDCNPVAVQVNEQQINILGLGGAPIAKVQIFNSSWATVFEQTYTSPSDNLNLGALPAGTYFVKLNLYTASWTQICEKTGFYTISDNIPAGTPGCNAISMTPIPVGVKIKGLVSPIVTVHIFDSNWGTVYNQTFTNSPDSVSIPLSTGTYRIKVNFYNADWSSVCEKFSDVVIGQIECQPGAYCITNDCSISQLTVNLNNVYSIPNLPAGTTVSWHTGTPATAANKLTASQAESIAVSGEYYAAINIAGSDCYSSTIKVIAVVHSCGTSSVTSNVSRQSAVINEASVKGNKIIIAPNPFTNFVVINIESDKLDRASLALLDVSGRSLITKTVQLQKGSNRISLDALNRYPAGNYFLRIATAEGVENFKLIRQ